MMHVGEDGEEYDDAWLEASEGEVYTPNYVSDVKIGRDGNAGFYIDCQGAVEPPMADAFRKILVEELVRQGVSTARVRVAE